MQVAYGEEYLVWYKLEGEETIFDVLHHCGLPLEKVWDYPNNKELKKLRKMPYWVTSGDEIRAPQKEMKVEKEKSEKLYRYQTRDIHIPLIDVYLGFMDEEVNARLERLIDSQKDKGKEARPVILIERGKLDFEKPILEWRIGNYKIDPTRIINVSPNGKSIHEKVSAQGGSDAPENILAQAMTVFMQWDIKSDLDWLARGLKVKRYFDLIKFLQHRRDPMKLKSGLPNNVDKDADGPWLSIVRFGVGTNENAPIIVIRTPEMGLQPSLMCPYIAFLFKAISAMSSQLAHEKGHNWEWPLRVSQFGAQGSSSEQKKPGSIDTVLASLFVGVEIASEVSISAKEGKKQTKFRYYPSSDSETAPHWEAADAADKKGSKGRYTKWKEDPQGKYHDYEDVKSDSNLTAYAVISFCTPAGVYDFVRQKIDGYGNLIYLLEKYGLRGFLNDDETIERHRRWEECLRRKESLDEGKRIEAAQYVAADIFRAQAREDRKDLLKLQKWSLDQESPYHDNEKEIVVGDKQPSLATVIEAIKQKYPEGKGVVTLTVSYFGCDEDKKAAEKLGIEGVNMEDYHVLKVLRSAISKGASKTSDYPLILKWRIDRINCDPKSIEGSVIEAFNKEIKNPYLTKTNYVDVIIWGLGGVLKGEIPACAKWNFAEKIEKEKFSKYLWSYSSNSSDVSDPFCIEIATDFINELADMNPNNDKPGGIAGIKETVKKHLKNPTDENIKDKLKELITKAKAVRNAWPNKETTKHEAISLMEFLENNCGFKADKPEYLKTWLRPGKWENITAPTIQDLNDQTFGGAAVDRAFYKSCNMMALQTMAHMYFF